MGRCGKAPAAAVDRLRPAPRCKRARGPSHGDRSQAWAACVNAPPGIGMLGVSPRPFAVCQRKVHSSTLHKLVADVAAVGLQLHWHGRFDAACTPEVLVHAACTTMACCWRNRHRHRTRRSVPQPQKLGWRSFGALDAWAQIDEGSACDPQVCIEISVIRPILRLRRRASITRATHSAQSSPKVVSTPRNSHG